MVDISCVCERERETERERERDRERERERETHITDQILVRVITAHQGHCAKIMHSPSKLLFSVLGKAKERTKYFEGGMTTHKKRR